MVRIVTLIVASLFSISVLAEDAGTEMSIEGVMGIEQVKTKTSFQAQRNDMLNKARLLAAELDDKSKAQQPAGAENVAGATDVDDEADEPFYNQILNSTATANRSRTDYREALEETNRTLEVESGENLVLYVSKGSPNRIRTPFQDPMSLADCEQSEQNRECIISVSSAGGVVTYQTITARPIGMFITPKDQPEVSINLSIRALDHVPPQDVYIKVKGYEPKTRTKEMDKLAEASDAVKQEKYNKWINDLAIELIHGKVPSGYAEIGSDDAMTCQLDRLMVEPGYILNGAENRIDVYRVVNDSQMTETIVEPQCYSKGVRFIFANPSPQLAPGEEAELFIVRKKPEPVGLQRTMILGAK
ncbi:MAG: hypothetical protein C9356_15690 [Oleiphilus sp.]|nr:MAG: hypothetical protein C9356_15690 [Oleiphilus sp.]